MILDFVFKIKKFIYTPKGTVQSRICKTFGGLGIIMLERAYLWLHGRSKKNDKVLLGFAEKPLNSTGLVDKHSFTGGESTMMLVFILFPSLSLYHNIRDFKSISNWRDNEKESRKEDLF